MIRLLASVGALLLALSMLGGCSASKAGKVTKKVVRAQSSQSAAPTESPSASPAKPDALKIRIDGNSVTPAARRIQLRTGRPLRLVITSDRAGELHLHSSPEQHLDFDAGQTSATVKFGVPGQVEIEEHTSGVVIATVVVR